ncbi:MAG: hypothetical protein HGB11_01695 [Chlorobiales bacterium]|nr:hypothetical protein [Chlorobiales bacterium]
MTEQEIDREIWSSVKKAALEQCDFFRHGGEVLIVSEAVKYIDGKAILDVETPKVLIPPDPKIISQIQQVLSIVLEKIDSVEKVRQLLSVKCDYVISGSVRKAKGGEVIKLFEKGDGYIFALQFIGSAKPYDFELTKTLINRLKELRELADLPKTRQYESQSKPVQVTNPVPDQPRESEQSKAMPEPEKIKWKGDGNQLRYVFEVLNDLGLLKESVKNSTLLAHFEVLNKDSNPIKPEPEKIKWKGDGNQLRYVFEVLHDMGLLKEPVTNPKLLAHFEVLNKKGDPIKHDSLRKQKSYGKDVGKPCKDSSEIKEALTKAKGSR